jgi:hypothetical protein
MIYTNKFEYPSYVIQYLENDEYDYDPDTFSATTLLKPPRVTVLERTYPDELEVDYSELVASRYGSSIHDSFEKVEIKGAIQEQRLKTLQNGMIVTGKFDMLMEISKNTYKLVDLKSTSAWTCVYGSKDEDYIKQLSIYRWLGNRNGLKIIDDAEICFFFTDWSKASANKNPNYPQSRIFIKPIKLMTFLETEEFINERIKLIRDAFIELPLCSDKELWKNKPDDPPRRCDYCSCKNVCNQYKMMTETKTI